MHKNKASPRQCYQTGDTLNLLMLKTLQVWVRTTPPDVISSVLNLKPISKGPVLLKKCATSQLGEGIHIHTLFFPILVCDFKYV